MPVDLTPYKLSDIIEWDIRNWSRALKFWQNHSRKIDADNSDLKAMELGARAGGLSAFLAGMGIHTTCTDLKNPEPTARPLHEKYQLENMINYGACDILDMKVADDTYDIVIFKSVLGDLGEFSRQQTAIKQIHRVLKKGGELWFAENLKGSKLHQTLRSKFIPWAGRWRYLESAELDGLLNDTGFGLVMHEQYGYFGAFGRNEKQRNILALLDQIVMPVIPENMRYIYFGLAVK